MKKYLFLSATILLYFIEVSIGFSQWSPVNKGLDAISNQSSQALLNYLSSD